MLHTVFSFFKSKPRCKHESTPASEGWTVVERERSIDDMRAEGMEYIEESMRMSAESSLRSSVELRRSLELRVASSEKTASLNSSSEAVPIDPDADVLKHTVLKSQAKRIMKRDERRRQSSSSGLMSDIEHLESYYRYQDALKRSRKDAKRRVSRPQRNHQTMAWHDASR